MRFVGWLIVVVALSGCGAAAAVKISAPRASKVARWSAFAHARRPLDVVGPLDDGSLVLAATGRLWLLSATGIRSFPARGGGYRSPGGEEPYIALSPGGCFGAGTIYALRLVSGPGIVAVSATQGVRRFARIRVSGLIDGIAFDRTGAFAHRLLVTVNRGTKTAVLAVDCHGNLSTIARSAPRVEGGIAVAPATFGHFAGDLIAPDEKSGKLFAITPQGKTVPLASSGLPHGPDIGVESEGFVPPGRAKDAFVADRLTPGNAHPGDDVVLRIPGAALAATGVHSGELLVATEGGALTDAVSCSANGCHVRLVAQGPRIAHAEGHIAFASLDAH